MAQNFTYAGTLGGAGVTPETKTFQVASGTTSSISVGDLVQISVGYAAKVANGGASSAGRFGLAVSNSNETASVAGTVDVKFSHVGMFLNGVASGIPTQSQLFPATGYTIAVSSGVQTVNLGGTGVIDLWTSNGQGLAPTTTNVQILVPWTIV